MSHIVMMNGYMSSRMEHMRAMLLHVFSYFLSRGFRRFARNLQEGEYDDGQVAFKLFFCGLRRDCCRVEVRSIERFQRFCRSLGNNAIDRHWLFSLFLSRCFCGANLRKNPESPFRGFPARLKRCSCQPYPATANIAFANFTELSTFNPSIPFET